MEIEDFVQKKKMVSVIGLGYVGLPLALVLAKKFRVIGFDINAARVAQMQAGIDPSQELTAGGPRQSGIANGGLGRPLSPAAIPLS